MTCEEYADAFRTGYRLTLRFLLSRGAAFHVAEEITQAAWAKGWEYRGQLQNPSRVAVWVNSIAKNMLLNQYGSRKNLEALSEAAAVSGRNGTHEAAEVGSVLRKCKPHDRDLLRRHYLEGFTTAEIAREIGVAPATIRVQLLRLRAWIRRRLRSGRVVPVRAEFRKLVVEGMQQ